MAHEIRTFAFIKRDYFFITSGLYGVIPLFIFEIYAIKTPRLLLDVFINEGRGKWKPIAWKIILFQHS